MDNMTQKVGVSWGEKLYGAKIGQKQAKKGCFRHFGENEEFKIDLTVSFGFKFQKWLFNSCS